MPYFQTAEQALRSEHSARFLEIYAQEQGIQQWAFAQQTGRPPYYHYETSSCNSIAQANALDILSLETSQPPPPPPPPPPPAPPRQPLLLPAPPDAEAGLFNRLFVKQARRVGRSG